MKRWDGLDWSYYILIINAINKNVINGYIEQYYLFRLFYKCLFK